MIRGGLTNLKKFKVNSNRRIGKPFKKQKSIDNNHKTIGKIKRRKYMKFLKLISSTPGLPNMRVIAFIEVLWWKKIKIIRNIRV